MGDNINAVYTHFRKEHFFAHHIWWDDSEGDKDELAAGFGGKTHPKWLAPATTRALRTDNIREERKQEVISRYLRGDALIDIIQDMDTTDTTIYNYLRKAGITPNRHRRKRS
jgi:hypothetical protein